MKDYRLVKNIFKSKEASEPRQTEEAPWWTGGIVKETEKKDYVCANTIAAMAILNGPTDLSDVFSAWKQIESRFKEKRPDGYDPKKAQHPFSFFRGTILHEYLNPNSEKCINKKWAKKVIKSDKPLVDTKFGNLILQKLGVEEVGRVQTNIKEITYSENKHFFVDAKVYKSKNSFGDMTVRALSRTPKYSIAALGALEGIHSTYNVIKGEDPKKELARVATKVVSTTAAVGYLGAVGYKHLATFGSLLGMGAGSLIGDKLTSHIFEQS